VSVFTTSEVSNILISTPLLKPIINRLDPNSSVITFQTRCCNNIAIDYTDTNYFASSSLDQPGLVVWDRRASNRSTASTMYLESFDQEEVPWGAALKLDRAIEVDKSVYIKQLRYSREERGALGVLSSAGQLQVLKTKTEYVEPDSLEDVHSSPEILEVETSFDLEYAFFDPDHKRKYEHRIVSFDWLNLGSPNPCCGSKGKWRLRDSSSANGNLWSAFTVDPLEATTPP
jgi:hypothetical protein